MNALVRRPPRELLRNPLLIQSLHLLLMELHEENNGRASRSRRFPGETLLNVWQEPAAGRTNLRWRPSGRCNYRRHCLCLPFATLHCGACSRPWRTNICERSEMFHSTLAHHGTTGLAIAAEAAIFHSSTARCGQVRLHSAAAQRKPLETLFRGLTEEDKSAALGDPACQAHKTPSITAWWWSTRPANSEISRRDAPDCCE